jgi:predicted RND superfamily exporter protein
MRRLMDWSCRHPVIMLAIVAALSIAAILPASRVRIETSIDNLMMKNDPAREFYLETRTLFGSEAMAIIYVEDRQLFTPAKLSTLQDLVFDLDALPFVDRSESIFSVTEFEQVDDMLDARPLIDWIPETADGAEDVRRKACSHPVIKNLLISETGDAVAIHLRIEMDNGNADNMLAVSAGIEAVISRHQNRLARVEQLGRPYVIAQQHAIISQDQKRQLPAAIGVIGAVLLLTFHSLKGALLPLLTSGISVLWTLAFMGLMDLPVNELTFMVPALILVIGSTEDIHLLADYRSGRRAGINRTAAVLDMNRRLAVAVACTALTTFAGFATIAVSPIPVLHQFGLAASFGMLINPLVTICIIPACLALLPDRANRSTSGTAVHKMEQRVLDQLEHLRRKPRTTLALVGIPCLLLGGWGARHVRADNNILGFFKPHSELIRRADHLEQKMAGTESIMIRLDAVGSGSFREPAKLGYALELQKYLDQQEWIDRSISLTDPLGYIHQTFTGKTEALPDTPNGIAEYLLLLHRSEIEPYVTSDFKSLNILVRHSLHSSHALAPEIDALRAYIAETCPPDLRATVTGEMLLVNKAVGAIVRGQLRSVFSMALFSALLMSLLFRSLRLGFAGMIPNLLPIGVQFGVMALAGIPLNTATSMAAAIGIGLAVDDTIHLLMRFHAQGQSLDAFTAASRSLQHLIRPVFTTTLSLSAGFLVMRLSGFTPIGDFALLAALVLMTALICDLILTPAILALPAPQKRRQAGGSKP